MIKPNMTKQSELKRLLNYTFLLRFNNKAVFGAKYQYIYFLILCPRYILPYIISFIFQKMGLKTLKGLIYHFDMFCSSELLRYNAQTQYKTLTGGLLSVAIICVIAGGFFNMVMDTLDRTSISSSLTVTKQSNPPLATLVPGEDNMFMLGLSIQSTDLTFSADLNNGPQYFTVLMAHAQIKEGINNYTLTPLEPCTKEHWKMMPEFVEGFDSFGVGGWLCLPLGLPIPIQGTYTSPVNQEAAVQVYPCNNQTSNNRCAPQEEIDALFALYQNFYFAFNYINPVINPNKQNFMSYYIEGHDYVIFSDKIGSEAWVQFTDYTVISDNSIWPFSDFTTSVGCIVEQKAINHPYGVSPYTSLATLVLAKSVNSLVYNRQVQKISAVFSYIGGLVGAITALLFLIKTYTDSSLEISIGIKLFQDMGPDDQTSGNFHLIGYIRLTFYRIIKFLGWSKKSEYSEQLEHYQQEAVRQLDVGLLLKRLIKLQSCIDRLFSPEQLAQIREANAITVNSAKKMRSLLMIQQVQPFDEAESASEMSGNALKGQQQFAKQQNGKKKTTSDMIASIYKRHSIDVDQEHIKRDKGEKQVRLSNPPVIVRPEGESSSDSSKRNILKRVKMSNRDVNAQQDRFEVSSNHMSIDSYVRFHQNKP